MKKRYVNIAVTEKTTLVNLRNGAKSTVPEGTRLMARVIDLPDGTMVCTAFEFIGDMCYVLTRTIKNGIQIQNFKMKNESEEISKDKEAGLFTYQVRK